MTEGQLSAHGGPGIGDPSVDIASTALICVARASLTFGFACNCAVVRRRGHPSMMLLIASICRRAGRDDAGRSVFDSPVTRRPPAPSEGPGPPPQKTKTNVFLTVTPPLQHIQCPVHSPYIDWSRAFTVWRGWAPAPASPSALPVTSVLLCVDLDVDIVYTDTTNRIAHLKRRHTRPERTIETLRRPSCVVYLYSTPSFF